MFKTFLGNFPFFTVSPIHVLSAAHCFLSPHDDLANLGLLVGDHDISIGSDTSYSALYGVAQVTKHPSYNPSNSQNDIAVVRSSTVIQYNAAVAPACLPFGYSATAFDNTMLEVPGWGTTMVSFHFFF